MVRSANVPDDTAPTVSAGGGGGTPMGVQASPNAFGAQVGGALEKTGGELDNTVNKFQGMIMETAANQAETGYITEAGKLTGKFKSLEGLQAQAAIPQYEQDMVNLRQSIRGSLPGAAARMFDSVTNRHESYALSDAYSYGAQQVKKANLDSFNASSESAISLAGSPSIAGNDEEFGHQSLGPIKFAVQSMMEQQGYGQYVTTDKEGKTTFADSPEGRQAQQVYNQELDKRTGMAWENRIHSLADQNVMSASKVLEANRDSIPGEAQVKLDAFMTPKMRNYEARSDADTILNEHTQQYQNIITGAKQPESKPADPAVHSLIDGKADELGVPRNIAHAVAMQESGENMHPPGSNDGGHAAGVYQLHAGAAQDTGVDRTTLDGNVTGGIKYLKTLHDKYGDWDKAIAAYNVGAGTLDAAGGDVSKVPQAQAYLKGVKSRMGGSDAQPVSTDVADASGRVGGSTKIESTAAVPSLADYYRTNYDSIVKEARDKANDKHPDDPTYGDAYAARVEQRMSVAIKGQELSYKADNDTVMKAVNGGFTKGTTPTSVDQLRASSPEAAAAWDRLTVNNPIAANAIENRILTATAKGGDKDSREYGSGFYRLFRAVHSGPTSPDHINDVSQLYSHVGESGDLTMAGLNKLNDEIKGKGTPEGEAESEMKKQFFANAKAEISGKNDALGIPDKKGEEQNLKFMAQAFPLYEKLKAQGKTPSQIFNPDSPDYLGHLIPAFKRPLSVQLQDINRDAAGIGISGAAGATRTPATILMEARSTTDPVKRAALKKELIDMKVIRDDSNEAKVPRPE